MTWHPLCHALKCVGYALHMPRIDICHCALDHSNAHDFYGTKRILLNGIKIKEGKDTITDIKSKVIW
jgi:hypothetical protein